MADNFLAEVRLFAGNFAPVGWAFCAGQLMPISQNTALFALIGTIYGGNGTSNFGLPNFTDRAPLFWGQGPGLSNYAIGQTGGSSTVTLLTSQLPSHNHTAQGVNTVSTQASPTGGAWAGAAQRPYTNTVQDVAMSAQALATSGGGQPHNNLQPYLGLTFIIALTGIFPSRP